MADIRSVTPTFSVAPQIEPTDMAGLAAAGYTLVINNRPDSEIPTELADAAMRKSAEAAGLAFVSIPISGSAGADQIDATVAALAGANGPVLAYCRSGTRSINAWAVAQAFEQALTVDEIIVAAKQAGYDLSHARAILQECYDG